MADEENSISTLPDEILQHILSFIPTELTVKTSILSRRWRHLWCDLPSLSFHGGTLEAATYCKVKNRYTAHKIMSYDLQPGNIFSAPLINMWLELSKSRNVENMSLQLPSYEVEYTFPDSFSINSFVKEIFIQHFSYMMTPRFVSWTSLKKLSLRWTYLFDRFIDKILSSCPILESLTLEFCEQLRCLDLSKLLHLRTLQLECNFWTVGHIQIVAPHTRCLRLSNSRSLCTLVDVSSFIEATLNMSLKKDFQPSLGRDLFKFNAKFIVRKLLEMLEKVQNVEKLAFLGDTFLSELRGETFPMFKVKDLTIETSFYPFGIPRAIERLLQNSPDLKKLTVLTKTRDTKAGEYLDQGWGLNDSVRWNMPGWSEETKKLASFMKLMLKNARTLEKMVVRLEDRYLEARGFKELAQTLSDNRDISIVFSTTPTT